MSFIFSRVNFYLTLSYLSSDKNGNRRDSQGKPKDSCLGKIAIGNTERLFRNPWY